MEGAPVGHVKNVKKRQLIQQLREVGFAPVTGPTGTGGKHERWKSPDGKHSATIPRGSGDVALGVVYSTHKAIKAYLASLPEMPQAVQPTPVADQPDPPAEEPAVEAVAKVVESEYACVTTAILGGGGDVDGPTWAAALTICKSEGLWTSSIAEARQLALIHWGERNPETKATRRFVVIECTPNGEMFRLHVNNAKDNKVTTRTPLAASGPRLVVSDVAPARPCTTGVVHPVQAEPSPPAARATPAAAPVADPTPPVPDVRAPDSIRALARIAQHLGLSDVNQTEAVVEKVVALRARERRVLDALIEAEAKYAPPADVVTAWDRVSYISDDRDKLVAAGTTFAKEISRLQSKIDDLHAEAQSAVVAPLVVPLTMQSAVSTMMAQLNAPVVVALRGGRLVSEQDALYMVLETGLRTLKLLE